MMLVPSHTLQIKNAAREDVLIEIDVQRPSGNFSSSFYKGMTNGYYVMNVVVRVVWTNNEMLCHSCCRCLHCYSTHISHPVVLKDSP